GGAALDRDLLLPSFRHGRGPLRRGLDDHGAPGDAGVTEPEVAHPDVASRDEWLAKRKELLPRGKEVTQRYDPPSAEPRRLAMVRIDKEYVFDGPNGKSSLLDLFDGKRQLIVYHFMFDPKWKEGCPGCTGYVDALGDLSMLGERNTAMVLI